MPHYHRTSSFKLTPRFARTTEDRLWEKIAECAKTIYEASVDSSNDVERKKQLVETPFGLMKRALRQLGIW